MDKIICPTDFSPTSLNALEFAASMGAHFQATVVLYHTITDDEYNELLGVADPLTSLQQKEEAIQQKMMAMKDEVEATYLHHGLLKCDVVVEEGNIADKIDAYAQQHDANFIVMGTKGFGTDKSLLVGSNARQVVSKASCPVMIVPGNASYKPLKKLVYATSYAKEDKQVMQKIIALATVYSAAIKVLHLSNRDNAASHEKYEQYKEELSSFVNYKSLTFELKIKNEAVELALDEYMTETHADLLVLLTSKRDFFESLFHRSIARRLAYLTKFPMLVYKTDELG